MVDIGSHGAAYDYLWLGTVVLLVIVVVVVVRYTVSLWRSRRASPGPSRRRP